LTFEDAMAIQNDCPHVRAVGVSLVAALFEGVTIKYQTVKTQDSLLLGMNEKWPDVMTVYSPNQGRFISASDVTHSANVCVLGSDLKETLFPHTNSVGKSIRIDSKRFLVVGELEKRGSMFGQSRDNLVGIPITTLMKHFPYEPERMEFIITPTKREFYETAKDEIINLLRQRRNVSYSKPNDFEIYGQDTLIDLYNQLTGAAYLVMIVISSIGLLVGGIGVMNIMLVTVKERTREIGIRKAIGARSGDILKQFLMEAIFLTACGGATGVFVGFLISLIVRSATPLPATVTLWSIGLGLFVSISVGLFFGIFPAQKAAKLDPIACLRYE